MSDSIEKIVAEMRVSVGVLKMMSNTRVAVPRATLTNWADRLASLRQVPDGLLDRVKAAEERINADQCIRRIPADPTDPDLVMCEVRMWLEGRGSPLWIKGNERKFSGVGELERSGYIPEGSAAEREASPATQTESLRQVPEDVAGFVSDLEAYADRLQRGNPAAAHHMLAAASLIQQLANPVTPTSDPFVKTTFQAVAERLYSDLEATQAAQTSGEEGPFPEPGPSAYEDEPTTAQAGAELPELPDHCEYLDVWVDGCHVERQAADLFYTADQMREMYRRGLKDADEIRKQLADVKADLSATSDVLYDKTSPHDWGGLSAEIAAKRKESGA